MVGSILVYAFTTIATGSFLFEAAAFAVNLIASSIISKALASPVGNDPSPSDYVNPGSRTQVAPSGSNKLPVVYGSAYVGGIVTDVSITADNQIMYFVLALSEVTNSENGGTPDIFTFGNIYYGGNLCVFGGSDKTIVTGLLDESTGITDTSVNGKIEIYTYRNGSSSGTNTSLTAIQVMQNASLTYQWDSTKLMSNCAFAIVKLTYNQEASITSLQQTRFQITNSRYLPGDCISDYLLSDRYGAALNASQIDSSSLVLLNSYCNQNFSYTTSTGATAAQTRFRFDGTVDTNISIMANLQLMSACCDCLIKYNEILGTWGVVVQSPSATVVMDINDTNMISSLTVTPTDIASSYNIAEVKYAEGTSKDTFSTAVFDLSVVAPALLYPNEPVNKQTISLPLVNNGVRAQYLANRFLKGVREDLQLQVRIDFSGLQLEAGDIVSVTNANYGWSNKPFRISRVTETFGDDGTITAALFLSEYNSTVYDDVPITQFQPAPNTGLSDPSFFGTVPAPTITGLVQSGYNPQIDVTITTSSAGITQYAELWYSTVVSPTSTQLTLAGTTAIAPNGNPYQINTALTPIVIDTLPAGSYFFFSRMRNALRASVYSTASNIVAWNPAWIPDVGGFVSSSTILSWEPVYSARLAGYKIRFQYGTSFDWGSANPLFDGLVTSTRYNASGLPSGRLTLLIKAIDTLGYESQNANSLVLTPGGLLTNNLVYSYDFRANSWPGTIVGGTISGGNIVANTTDSFYGQDDQSLYGTDTTSFYDLTSVASIVYTTSQIYVTGALTGSLGALFATTLGKDVTIEYRRVSGGSFYGQDGDSLYGADNDASFYQPDSAWSLMPGNLAMANDYYQFRVTVGAGTIGEIDALTFQVDAPDMVEVLSNRVVNGGAIAYTKNFTAINAILVTLQTNSLGVVTIETNKTVPLIPTVTGYNSSHVATSGALADITLQGY